MYAIVDIETTGGYAAAHGITEISILLHDGQGVQQQYETLVNPQRAIPYHIQVLTGITNEMIASAPVFEELAEEVHGLMQNRIFVAHNVNFDYSFIRHHLAAAGHVLQCKKLCTVRLSRKIFPGLPSYSLGNLCRHFSIPIYHRHRAGGDARATAQLFEHLLQHDTENQVLRFLQKGSCEQSLPPHLPKEQVLHLPSVPGVYYFHDQQGKVIYVGKARQLKQRVLSHFNNNNPSLQKQDFLRNIYRITYQCTGTELMAFVQEALEIRRLWPRFNRSLKQWTFRYGLYSFEDQNGYLRLAIELYRKSSHPLYTFQQLIRGHQLLRQLICNFELCPQLCFLQTSEGPCARKQGNACRKACEQAEVPAVYNLRVQAAIDSLQRQLPSFAIVGEGRNEAEYSCLLLEKGHFYGLGFVPKSVVVTSVNEWKQFLTPHNGNDYIDGLLLQYAALHPEQCWKPDEKILLPV